MKHSRKIASAAVMTAAFLLTSLSVTVHGTAALDLASATVLTAVLVLRIPSFRKNLRIVFCAVILLIFTEASFIGILFPWVYLALAAVDMVLFTVSTAITVMNPLMTATRSTMRAVIDDSLSAVEWSLLIFQSMLSALLLSVGAHHAFRMILPLLLTLPLYVYIMLEYLNCFEDLTFRIFTKYHSTFLKRHKMHLRKDENIEARVIYKGIYDGLEAWLREGRAFLTGSVSEDDAALYLGTNRSYISMAVRYYARMTYSTYVNSIRLEYAMKLAEKNPSLSVTELAHLVNLSPTTFSMAFRRRWGISPKEWLIDLRQEHKK